MEAIVPFAKTLPELRIAFFGSGYLYGEQKILEAVREALPTQEMHITVIDPIYKEAIGALAEFKADQVCTSYTQVAEMPHVLIALNLEGETAIQEYFFFQVEIEIFHDNSLTVMLQNRDTDSYSIVSTVNGQLSKMDFQL